MQIAIIPIIQLHCNFIAIILNVITKGWNFQLKIILPIQKIIYIIINYNYIYSYFFSHLKSTIESLEADEAIKSGFPCKVADKDRGMIGL